jgi:hypothetical protein
MDETAGGSVLGDPRVGYTGRETPLQDVSDVPGNVPATSYGRLSPATASL